jgi:glutamate synthase domain-containing protein 2
MSDDDYNRSTTENHGPPIRYHIARKNAPLCTPYPARFRLQHDEEYVKYGHSPFELGCGGDNHWTPEIITQIWYQAETGKIPISGSGFGGKFAGSGFDGMWLDMSEIVRPTRDGIHGREYISTLVALGRKKTMLRFDPKGKLLDELPPNIEVPFPVLFSFPVMPVHGRGVLLSIVKAASQLGTFVFLEDKYWASDLQPFVENIVPRLSLKNLDSFQTQPLKVKMVEIDYLDHSDAISSLIKIKKEAPNLIISIRLPISRKVGDQVEKLVHAGAEVIHLCADHGGMEPYEPDPLFIKDRMQLVHRRLVEKGIRDRVSIIVSGGIASAEHVPKVIACGADSVAIDFSLLVGLGCALWADEYYPCPVEHVEIDSNWGSQRIVNLMSAWRDQLLEVLGAMGMREVRRLRGEMGRSISYEIEKKNFSKIFTNSISLKSTVESEKRALGDYRWPPELLRATAEQARTGRPPTSNIEYRVGCSGGGFDRLAFIFEKNNEQFPLIDDNTIDLSINLNKRGDGPHIRIPFPVYGGGMSFGSISLNVMLARARAAKSLGTFISTGEGGYPEELMPYSDHIITQVATGLFGVREETILRARMVEFKYAQGAKPGLGGHLLAGKVTRSVAEVREAVAGRSLYSPFPFHSVYSVEDHKKHVDWIKVINPHALISVKVSTPTDVDMVAVGSYFAGANIIHLDGGYGSTGAAPEVSKKNIAMPIEYAIPKVHYFLLEEGIRDQVILMASGGIRSAYDVAKAIALGADGAVIGSAELIALGCERYGKCEKGEGCPSGITTTDPNRCSLIDIDQSMKRIVNMYKSWQIQLRMILNALGMRKITELIGRTDCLVYINDC